MQIKEFFKNPLLTSIFGGSIFLGVVNFLVLFFFIRKLNNLIILHYNVYLGVDLVGYNKQILLMPLVGISFTIVNLILAIYFFNRKERMLSHILSLTALLSQLGISVAGASIIIVNYF